MDKKDDNNLKEMNSKALSQEEEIPVQKTPEQMAEDAAGRKKLFSIGVMIFLTFLACIIVFFLIYRYQGLNDFWGKLMLVLQPILFGMVGAYLVNPIMKAYEKAFLRFFLPRSKNEKRTKKGVRHVSIALGLITFLAIIAALIAIIIPQMILNIADLAESVPKQVKGFTNWVSENADSPILKPVLDAIDDAVESFVGWLKTDFLKELLTYIVSIVSSVYTVIKSILNLLIGIVVAVYILETKEKFKGQTKKIIYAFASPSAGNKIVGIIRRSNEIFGGFIIGKIIDSMIIGVIAYVACLIMRMPYPALLGIIIGVTNIIPFFGPFIGAIPCVILVGLHEPIMALYMTIFIVVLQQVDGNIIGPKILGDYTGLTSFWVIFSILIFGGFFGVPGMILGVPVFAVIYYLLKRFFEYKLRKKNMPTETEAYVRAVKLDSKTMTLKYPEDLSEEEVRTEKKQSLRKSALTKLFRKKKEE